MRRERDVAKHWDDNAQAWSEGLGRGDDVYRRAFHEKAFLRFLGPVKGLRLLDAGCGDGHLTRTLAARGARVEGVDLSRNMLDRAEREEARRPKGIRYRQQSYTRLSGTPSRSIDTAVAFMSLMDGPDLEGAFEELRRVLKPRGTLVFAVLHPCFAMASFGWWTGAPDRMPRLQIAGYFDRTPRVQTFSFPGSADGSRPFAVPRFPRTLSDYTTALTQAGFSLDALAEPRPSAAACRKHPALAPWRDHAAAFLHVRARPARPGV